MTTIWQWPDFLLKLGISLFLLFTYSHADIPLPGQGIAQSRGVTAGMGFGTQNHANCKTLWTWTGYGQYSYNPFLSGGISIKFLGGNLDSANNLVYQRYSANAKIMNNRPRYALFIGPTFSFENTNMNALREEFSNRGEENRSNTECHNLFANIGSSIGYHSGIGFLATPNWGFSLGHNLDLTLKGVVITFFSGSIAFNLREQFEKLIENTKNVWLSLEYSISLTSKDKIEAHNIILGLAVGF